MSFDWKALVRTVAPGIAGAFGTPVAGVATKFLVDALLPADKRASATDADLSSALANATPETMLALKKANDDFAAHMADIGVDMEKIAAGDRDSARKREMSVKDWMPRALGLLIIGTFLGCAVGVIFGDVAAIHDTTAALQIGTIIGYLVSEAKQVTTYYFGSSAGSKIKDATIAAKT